MAQVEVDTLLNLGVENTLTIDGLGTIQWVYDEDRYDFVLMIVDGE